MFKNIKNNISIILLLLLVILSCLYFTTVTNNANISEGFTNKFTHLQDSVQHDTSYNYKTIDSISIDKPSKPGIKFSFKTGDIVIDASMIPDITNLSTALNNVYENKYDGYYIDTIDGSLNFFTINDGAELHIHSIDINSKLSGSDVSSIDISNYNIDLLLKFDNELEPPLAYVDISNNPSNTTTIKTLYLNNEMIIFNSRLQLPADSSVEISNNIARQSVTQDNYQSTGDITVNTAESGDTSLLSHLLKNYNNDLNFVNPYLANNFEHAMNSNLNPFVNNPSKYNPHAYANYFNPSNSDMLMRSNVQNQNIDTNKQSKNTSENSSKETIKNSSENSSENTSKETIKNSSKKQPVGEIGTNLVDYKTSGQLLELPKSNREILDHVDSINKKSMNNINPEQSVECTCPNKKNYKDESTCPPCPACDRCPEQDFTCKKVYKNKKNQNNKPINSELIENSNLSEPIPVLSDFSTFGM